MPTMWDVARAAGVSQAAVSYAYNHPERVSAERRERIFEAAKTLGYAGPDPAGRRLRTGQAGAIGLILTESLPFAFDDPATSLILKGVAEVGEQEELGLSLLPCSRAEGEGSDGAGVLLRAAVDGFLAYAMPSGHPAMSAALSRRLPIVIIDGPPVRGVPRAGIDERAAARLCAQHLISLGHRRFAILVDRLHTDGYRGEVADERLTLATDFVMHERVQSYLETLDGAGVPRRDITVIEAGGHLDEHVRAAADLALTADGVTAVLAVSDVLALAAMDAAANAGMSVPEDVSVVGFDDIPAAASAGLTTIDQALTDRGRQATQLLLRSVRGSRVRSVVSGVELRVRTSSAAAPRGR